MKPGGTQICDCASVPRTYDRVGRNNFHALTDVVRPHRVMAEAHGMIYRLSPDHFTDLLEVLFISVIWTYFHGL
jgi:hypothetical protein